MLLRRMKHFELHFSSVLLLTFFLGCATSVESTSSTDSKKITPERDSVRIGVGVGAELLPSHEADNEDAIGEVPPREIIPVLSAVERSILDEEYTYYNVRTLDTTGWVSENEVPQPSEYANNKRLVDQLRQEGYTVIPVFQTFSKNSADGITLQFGVINLWGDKTVKYVRSTWKLFNSVGDPVEGENSGESIAKAKLTGPLKPGEAGTAKFENVWYSPTATCAELRGLQVEFIDGSTFSTADFRLMKKVADIDRISEKVTSDLSVSEVMQLAGNLAEGSDLDIGFRAEGDCSYESQQKREGQ